MTLSGKDHIKSWRPNKTGGVVRSGDQRALKLTCKHAQAVNQTDGNISGPEPGFKL